MQSTNESCNSAVDAVKDALRYIGDASYAILPEDVAHRLAELKKNFWGVMRTVVDKELEWIDERVAGGDRLREEWRQRRSRQETGASPGESV